MKKILVVDDEEAFTDLLRMNLERTGEYLIRVENQSDKALDSARQFKPDIILLDVVMPGKDGGDVSAELSSDPDLRNVPVIFVSALVSPDENDASGIAYSDGRQIMAKPIRIKALIENIEAALA